jgi:adenylate cyclase class IV
MTHPRSACGAPPQGGAASGPAEPDPRRPLDTAARNVEIKARIVSVEALLPAARSIAGCAPETIHQDDTFFACPHGRLKLRDFGDGRGELIQYQRADAAGPRTSTYVRAPTAAPDPLREALARALGTLGRVRKQRWLLLAGRTRIHLDRVDGLGDFLELEVVLRDGEAEADGIAEAHALMAQLGVRPQQLLAGAYLDLLAAAR